MTRKEMNESECTCVCTGECSYWYFFKVLQEWTWISTTPVGFSLPTPNQTDLDMGVVFYIDICAWTWISTTHTDLSLHYTPKRGVPLVKEHMLVFECVPLCSLRAHVITYHVGYCHILVLWVHIKTHFPCLAL